MSTLFSLTSSLDDIVFEGRNKAYGAFELRQLYGRHLRSALLITLSLCLLLLLVPLAARYFAPVVVEVPPFISTSVNPQVYDMRTEVVKPKTAAPTAPPPIAVTPHSDIATRVVVDNMVKPAPHSELPQSVGPTGPATGKSDDITAPNVGVVGGTGSIADTATPPVVAPTAPLVYAEHMPTFAGGQEALKKYLQKHLHWPGAALANQVSGRVVVTFVVQADGTITDVAVPKGLGYGTEEAAARVVREMPAWEPGMQNQHPVPVRFTLPITLQYE